MNKSDNRKNIWISRRLTIRLFGVCVSLTAPVSEVTVIVLVWSDPSLTAGLQESDVSAESLTWVWLLRQKNGVRATRSAGTDHRWKRFLRRTRGRSAQRGSFYGFHDGVREQVLRSQCLNGSTGVEIQRRTAWTHFNTYRSNRTCLCSLLFICKCFSFDEDYLVWWFGWSGSRVNNPSAKELILFYWSNTTRTQSSMDGFGWNVQKRAEMAKKKQLIKFWWLSGSPSRSDSDDGGSGEVRMFYFRWNTEYKTWQG